MSSILFTAQITGYECLYTHFQAFLHKENIMLCIMLPIYQSMHDQWDEIFIYHATAAVGSLSIHQNIPSLQTDSGHTFNGTSTEVVAINL